jgi:hypothetical protein
MASAPLFTPHSAGDPQGVIIERWRRRSRVVGFWRIILPLSIFAICLALAGWIVSRSLLKTNIIEVIEATDRLISRPQFYGLDKDDRTYLITAIRGLRDAANRDKFTLDNPSFNLGGGSVRADKGIYIKGSTKVELRGHVVAINSAGSRMTAEVAQVDTRTGTISNTGAPGSGRMSLETRSGRIAADDYTIAKNGVVTFRGRVQGVINGK